MTIGERNSNGGANVDESAATSRWNRDRVVLPITWILSALYLRAFALRGWIAGDEGFLGQSAERVLRGELPHREFIDQYTGGLAFLHAGTFALLGTKLTSLRWLLLGAAILAVPVFYRLARRAAGPLPAAAITFLCVAAGPPNYFASMPSWYNLYLGAAGVLALLRWIETERPVWLALAGVCAGASFAIKSVGLLFVAAVLLFLVYREGSLRSPGPRTAAGRIFSVFVTLGVLAFAASLVAFVGQRPTPMDLLLFVVPGQALVALILWEEWRGPAGPPKRRFARLLGWGGLFLGGASIPVLLLLVPYALEGALLHWWQADFLFPARRMEYTTAPLPRIETLVFVLPMALVLALPLIGGFWTRWDRRIAPVLAVLAALLVSRGDQPAVYQSVWFSLWPVVPVLALVAVAMLGAPPLRRRIPVERRQTLFLLVAACSLASLLQFPFSIGLYFLYFAPLLVLAVVFLAGVQPGGSRRTHGVMLAFYLVFLLSWTNFGSPLLHGFYFLPAANDTVFAIDRGGLLVPEREAGFWEGLTRKVRALSEEDAWIYAGPDAPEVYFFAARRNPTESFVDYFEPDFGTPGRTARLLATLEEHDVSLAVLNRAPAFSPLSEELATAIRDRFPACEEHGRFLLCRR